MKEHVVESSAKIMLDLNDKIRVLHVDDDSGILKITKQCLEMEGPLQVDAALSVEEALRKLENGKYDIVVSDYQMPGKDGLDLLKALRSKGNAIPFIMFTGKGREEVAIKALNLGANQYVNKVGEAETVYVELAHNITELAKTRRAEEKQCESEEKFRNLFEKANDGLVFLDLSGKIVDINQKAAEIAEKRKEDIVGRPFFDLGLVSSKNLPILVEKLRAQATGKPTERFEFEIEKENGEKRFIEITSTIIQENNVPTGSLAIVRDVTERKRTEEALRKSEAELSAQFYGSPDLIMILDRKHRYVRINRPYFLSYDFRKLIGKDAIEPLPPDQRDLARANVDQCFATGRIQVFEHNLLNGEKILARIVPLQSAGAVDQVMIVSTNITERKKTERELDLFSSAVKASLDGIITGDLNGNIAYANEAALRMYGSNDKRDLIGKNVQDLLVERDRTRAQQNGIETVQTGQGKTVEYTVLTKNGIEVPMEITTQLLMDERDEPTGFVDIIRDLAERKKAEGALSESEERYCRLSAAAFEGIGIDEQGKVADANDQLAKMLGYEPGELIGKAVLDLVAPESRDFVLANRRKGCEGPYEHLALRKDGSVFPVEIRTGTIHHKGHTARVCAIRDITERKRADEDRGKILHDLGERVKELRCLYGISTLVEKPDISVDELLQQTVDLLPEAWQYSDIACARIVVENREFKTSKFGESNWRQQANIKINGERIGFVEVLYLEEKPQVAEGPFLKEERDLIDAVAERLGRIVEHVKAERMLKEDQDKFEGLFKKNPEAAVYLGPDFRIQDINPRFEELFGYSLEEIKGKHIDKVVVPKDKMDEANVLDKKGLDGYVYHNTKRRRKDGSLVPVAVSAAPIIVEGKPIGFVAVYKDISDMKGVEKRLESMNEKLQVVGGLTRHDVRNKLGVVTGNAFLLKKKYADHTDIVDGLKDMEQACTEIVRIFDFAKTYEMLGVEDMTYIDVEKTFSEAASLFSGLINLKVVNDCHGLTVLADSLLRQLFYNLIDNSLKYGKKTTTIKAHYEKTEQDKLEVFYEDDGVGIPVANKPHIFKEGFSTGGSTGYGLYLIKKMIEVYGWTIQEKGETGKGVLFAITIPKINQNGKENYNIV